MAVADTSVKILNSVFTDAPSIPNGTAGNLITVLDACLVNGFNEITLDSLVVSSDVATATLSTGHGFTMIGPSSAESTTSIGPVIVIAGATPAALNGEWRIASVTDANTFTFETADIADGTATGTITAKYAPMGWTKEFSGTNKAVYRNDSVLGSGTYLRVVNTSSNYAIVEMFRTMSDVDTGTFGSSSADIAYIPYYQNNAPTPWILIGDSCAFYWFIDIYSLSNVPALCHGFCGNLSNSFSEVDINNCVLAAPDASSYTSVSPLARTAYNATALVASAPSNQTGNPLKAEQWVHLRSYLNNMYAGYGGIPFSSFGASALFLLPRLVTTSAEYRGDFPGLFDTINAVQHKITDLTVFTIAGHPNIFMYKRISYWTGTTAPAAIFLDLSGPWR